MDRKTKQRRAIPRSASVITSEMDVDMDEACVGTHTTPSLDHVKSVLASKMTTSGAYSSTESSLTSLSSLGNAIVDDTCKSPKAGMPLTKDSYILPSNAEPVTSEIEDADDDKSYLPLPTIHPNMSKKLLANLGSSSSPIDVDQLFSFIDPVYSRTHVRFILFYFISFPSSDLFCRPRRRRFPFPLISRGPKLARVRTLFTLLTVCLLSASLVFT